MREIKFRVWDSYWRKFDYGGGDLLLRNQNSNPVMQYTGITDKKGREIYEGDVLCIDDWYSDTQNGIAINRIPNNRLEAVEWSVDGMWITTDSELLMEQASESEVVGNIYENPELLT